MSKPHYRMKADGQIHEVNDGLRNLTANLGTSRDKAHGTEYLHPTHNEYELTAMYRASFVSRKIVDMPARDSFRQWRDWQAEGDQINKIEATEKRLGLKAKLVKAAKRARLLGGAAIYIATNDADLSKPLDPSSKGRGSINYLTVVGRSHLNAGDMDNDPSSETYGMPRDYTILSNEGTSLTIHPSRLVLFRGAEMPDDVLTASANGWGDSVLTSCLAEIRNQDATAANIASLVFEAKIDVMKIPDLMRNLQDKGQAYENLVISRATLAATGKSINGTLLMDANEEYDQKTVSFATLPDILVGFMQLTSGAANIPMTLLFGMSPGGLNATGESDVRGYYDHIKAMQELEFQPAMSVLDEMVIRDALGDRPDEVFYNWSPLWQPTTKERAETGKTLADTFKIVSDIDAAPAEVVSRALINALTEAGVAPGLEADMVGYYETDPDSAVDDPLLSDASPKTLYVRRNVTNAAEIIAWAKDQGFETTLPADDMHVTIAFSRTPVDWMKMGESWSEEIKVAAGGARIMDKFGDANVLLFAGSELSWRHEEMKNNGAEWDHQEYQPHITISYGKDAPDLSDVEPYRGEIILGPEIFQEIDEKWLEGVAEE